MANIEYKSTKNYTEFKPRTVLDLNIGYTPTEKIQGVQQLYRPQIRVKQETPIQESPAETVSHIEEPAMIVATPERVQKVARSNKDTQKIQKAKAPNKVTRGTIDLNGVDVGNMQHILDKFADAGISVKVTSGRRKVEQAGKAGSKSHHITGRAIDIVPGKGETFESMKEKIKNNPELLQYFRDNKIGIIDETTEEVMKRTGATGTH